MAESRPRPPVWFDERHVATWKRAVANLRAAGTLHQADQDTLVGYVRAVLEHEEAARLVQSAGVLIKGANGEPVRNPAVMVEAQSRAAVLRSARALGLVDRSGSLDDLQRREAIKAGARARGRTPAAPDGRRRLRDAYDASLSRSAAAEEVDAALVEAGRAIADHIDAAVSGGAGDEVVTKALYLTPHLVNILRELLATPASRIAAGQKQSPDGGKLAQLRAMPGGKSGKRARG